MWTIPVILFTHAFTTDEAGEGGLGNAFARSMFTVAVNTRAENANGFQPARIEKVVMGKEPFNEPVKFRVHMCRAAVEGSPLARECLP
jgi:hypothetical protein